MADGVLQRCQIACRPLALRIHQADLRPRFQNGHFGFQQFGKPLVIGIDARDVLAARFANSGIHRGADAPMLLRYIPNSRVGFLITAYQRFGGVDRAIVHNHHFEIAKGLREHAFDRSAEQ